MKRPAGAPRAGGRVSARQEERPAASAAFDQVVRLYKEGLDRSDSRPVEEFLGNLPDTDLRAMAAQLGEFLKAERARLVKLRTLGLSRDFASRVEMTDRLIAVLQRKTP